MGRGQNPESGVKLDSKVTMGTQIDVEGMCQMVSASPEPHEGREPSKTSISLSQTGRRPDPK